MFVSQREYLRGLLLHLAKENRLYANEMHQLILERFQETRYKPSRSEIYKNLHYLVDKNIIVKVWKDKEGTKLQQVAIYVVSDWNKCNLMLEELKGRIEGLTQLLEESKKWIDEKK